MCKNANFAKKKNEFNDDYRIHLCDGTKKNPLFVVRMRSVYIKICKFVHVRSVCVRVCAIAKSGCHSTKYCISVYMAANADFECHWILRIPKLTRQKHRRHCNARSLIDWFIFRKGNKHISYPFETCWKIVFKDVSTRKRDALQELLRQSRFYKVFEVNFSFHSVRGRFR